MTDQIALVDRATALAADVVSAVKPDQLDLPTPCTKWTVRDLLNHMVGTAELFASAGEGERSAINPFGQPDDVIGDNPQAAYGGARTKLLAVWRARGTDGNVPLLQGETPASVALTVCLADQLQHTWDLAQAIGHDFDPDDELIDAAEEFTYANMSPEHRGPDKAFGHVCEAPDGASRIDRLAAFMGRRVQ